MLRPNQDQRKKGFKKVIDADEARRKREDAVLAIRKEKKEENLQKKRNVGMEQAMVPQPFAQDSTRGNFTQKARCGNSRCLPPKQAGLWRAALSGQLTLLRPAPAAREPPGDGAGRVLGGPERAAGGDNPVPQAALHWCAVEAAV